MPAFDKSVGVITMRIVVLAGLAAGLAALVACNPNTAKPSAATPQGKQLVYEVDSVILRRSDNGLGLTIMASGTARSAGWSAPELQQDTQQSKGDLVVYRFLAMPPPKDKNVPQPEQPVEAVLKINNLAPEVKTIRVQAETNRTDSAVADIGQHSSRSATPDQPPAAPFAGH